MKWRDEQGLARATLDPYFEWAECTAWRGFRRLMGQSLGSGDADIQNIRVLVQANNAASARAAMDWPNWKVAQVYKDSALTPRHFVAELPLSHLDWLKKLSPSDIRWEVALPFRDAETAARAQPVGAFGETRSPDGFRSGEVIDVSAPKAVTGKLPKPLIKGPVMAVIDFGCPFMNEVFRRDSGTSRIEALWDQGADRSPTLGTNGNELSWPWTDTSARMGYGRSMRGPTIARLLREHARLARAGTPLDESEVYRRIDYLIDYDDPRRRVWAATHGSHVASVAAGWPDPLLPSERIHDEAADAPIVFVQLPALTAADSGGGSLSAQVLDALHYILDVCEQDTPIIITLSYGSFAGPHDGSSLIEQALDEILLARGKDLAVVLGAGNGRQAACHVSRRVREDRSALLRVHLDPGDFTDTFVETWFQPGEALLSRLRARARAADGDWSPWISVDQSVQMHEKGDRRPVARLSFQKTVPNGKGPLLLLALAPTARPADDDGPLASEGSWQIEVCLEPAATSQPGDHVDFEAWVERDDPGWLGFGVQPRFEEQRVGDDEQTLSSLATGRYTIAAGGFRLSDSVPVSYSSTGRRSGPPLVYAACEESASLPTIEAAAVRSGDSLRMNGTSVAAPVLARRIYNYLVKHPGVHVDVGAWDKTLESIVKEEFKNAGQQNRPSILRKASPNEDKRAGIGHRP